jgi:synaptosomal-associated protein 25
MFSKTWKPKKTREIAGPIITAGFSLKQLVCFLLSWSVVIGIVLYYCVGWTDYSSKRSENHSEQRVKLGLAPAPRGRSASRTPPPEPTNALQKVEVRVCDSWLGIYECRNICFWIYWYGYHQNQVEKEKQDDALSDLSNLLGDLKNMAVDMGGELNRSVLLRSHANYTFPSSL